MRAEEKELIDLKFRGVIAMIEANQELDKKYHKELVSSQSAILEQVKETNGRVTSLEGQTRFFRWVERNPKASIFLGILLVAGFISLGTFIGWNVIADKLI